MTTRKKNNAGNRLLMLLVGLFLYAPIFLSKFYIMDAGFYLMTGSALLGFLLNTLLFGAIYTVIRLLFILLTKKNMEKELFL